METKDETIARLRRERDEARRELWDRYDVCSVCGRMAPVCCTSATDEDGTHHDPVCRFCCTCPGALKLQAASPIADLTRERDEAREEIADLRESREQALAELDDV